MDRIPAQTEPRRPQIDPISCFPDLILGSDSSAAQNVVGIRPRFFSGPKFRAEKCSRMSRSKNQMEPRRPQIDRIEAAKASGAKMCENHWSLQCLSSRPSVSLQSGEGDIDFDSYFTWFGGARPTADSPAQSPPSRKGSRQNPSSVNTVWGIYPDST